MENYFMDALSIILNPHSLFLIIVGSFIGIMIGAMPGLTVAMGIAVFLPVTFGMDASNGLMMLIGIYVGAMYGGSISAILVNIPGTPGAVATNLDGYPLARKGLAGQAIGYATVGSCIGGIVGAIALTFLAPPIARFSLNFGAPEYFALAVFGLTIIASISGKSLIKGLIAGAIGLLLSIVGWDPITNVSRFTFGSEYFLSGFQFVPVMIGIFGLSEVFHQLSIKVQREIVAQKLRSVIPRFSVIKKFWKTGIWSSLIGVAIGTLPAAGGSIASIVAYSEAKRNSKTPEQYGQGSFEGIFAAETANNAAVGGAMVPLLTFGIPGDAITAVLLGAFMIHDLQPGPRLFLQHGDVVNSMFIALAISSIVILFLGLGFAKFFARIISFPLYYLLPVVTVLCVVGSYAFRNSIWDVMVVLLCGLIGLLMKLVQIPPGAVILGLVLGPIAEANLRRALIVSDGSMMIFLTRPISAVLIVLAILSLCYPLIKKHFASKNKQGNADSKNN